MGGSCRGLLFALPPLQIGELTARNRQSAEHAMVTGDDRGGIAFDGVRALLRWRFAHGGLRREHARATRVGDAALRRTLRHGIEHELARLTREGVAVAVFAGVLLDRVAPRLRNRTEATLAPDAWEVRQLPDNDVMRIANDEVVGFEVALAFEPLSPRPTTCDQVNAMLSRQRGETVFPAISEREEAEWLRRFLADQIRSSPRPWRRSARSGAQMQELRREAHATRDEVLGAQVGCIDLRTVRPRSTTRYWSRRKEH